MTPPLSLLPITGLPLFHPGDPLVEPLAAALQPIPDINPRDILVVAHKIISRTRGYLADLQTISPGPEAVALARRIGKDPRKVEVILRESRSVVKAEWIEGQTTGVLICEHLSGHVCANAGVDESNSVDKDLLVLLPRDPDAEARRLRAELAEAIGFPLPVLISDTFGRPWRRGLVNVAVGCAGLEPLIDLRGTPDLAGRPLTASIQAAADELAAAAGLLMRKTNRVPAVLIRGFPFRTGASLDSDGAVTLVRPKSEDLFR